EVDPPGVVPAALEPCELGGPCRGGERLPADALRVFDPDPFDRESLAVPEAAAHVFARLADDGEGVKLPACGIRAIGFRHVAIEAARVRVLGFVKEAGARIRRGRLVREASGVVNRSAVTDAEARHLEYVTVVEAVGSIVERVERFFAADPAAPWRQTSGA